MVSSRLLLFENGAALGVFSKTEGPTQEKTTSIVLEPTGTTFTLVLKDGTCLRQLSDYCKQAVLPQLSALTTFRNLHSARPYLSSRSRRKQHGLDDEAAAATPNTTTGSYLHVTGGFASPPSHQRRQRRHASAIGLQSRAGSARGSRSASTNAEVLTEVLPPRGVSSGGVGCERSGGVDANWTRRRRDCRGVSRIAVWPATADDAKRHCTVRADGSVELRALGGNARLVLSGLRSLVEVDFATPVVDECGNDGAATTAAGGRREPSCFSLNTTSTQPTDYGGSRVSWEDLEGGERREGTADANRLRGGIGDKDRHLQRRVWVTQQFLVSAVPPAFTHPLGVALRFVGHPPGLAEGRRAGGVLRAGGGRDNIPGGNGDGGRGSVSSELPLPEDMPDHPRWDMVKASSSGVYYGEQRHLISQLYSREAGDLFNGDEPGHLLAVDILKLAQGSGYAGTVAVIVDHYDGCTYRIVRNMAARVGTGVTEDGFGVHVVVHADGSEVLLEGDFIRLLHPASPANPRPRSHLLHVSATTTVCFSVTVPGLAVEIGDDLPPPRRLGLAATVCRNLDDDDDDDDEVNAINSGIIHSVSGTRLSHVVSISVGDITVRALAFRQQFVSWTKDRGRRGEQRLFSGVSPAMGRSRARLDPERWHQRGIASDAALGGGMENYPKLAPAFEHPMAAAVAEPRPSFVPLIVPAGSEQPSFPAGPYCQDHHHHHHHHQQQYHHQKAHAATPAMNRELVVSAEVLEKIELGGASFVLFADGRARGAFRDRTIVSLPFPADCSLRDGEGGKLIGGRFPVRTSGGDIECILPDGTVVRLNGHYLLQQRILGRDIGGISICDDSERRQGWRINETLLDAGDRCSHAKLLKPYVLAVRRFADWAAADPSERRAKSAQSRRICAAAIAEAERNRRFVDLRRLRQSSAVATAADGRGGVDKKAHRVEEVFTAETEACSHAGSAVGENDGNTHSQGTPSTRLCYAGRNNRERNSLGGQSANVPVVVTPDSKSAELQGQENAQSRGKERVLLGQRRRVKFMEDEARLEGDKDISSGLDNDHHRSVLPPAETHRTVGDIAGLTGAATAAVGTRERNEIVRRLLEANRDALLGGRASREVRVLRGMR